MVPLLLSNPAHRRGQSFTVKACSDYANPGRIELHVFRRPDRCPSGTARTSWATAPLGWRRTTARRSWGTYSTRPTAWKSPAKVPQWLFYAWRD